MREVGQVILQAHDSAKGGMLVLLTGYERLESLAASLRELQERRGQRFESLIVQSRAASASRYAAEFRQAAHEGKRPIWLATGPAWTGLDLADRSLPDSRANEDFLLTDLVIPAVPFGMDKTSTTVSRTQFAGFSVEVLATQKRLRQGIGRLVRRDGLLHRRLWMLDGRLWHPSMTYMTNLRRLLLAYPKSRPFSVQDEEYGTNK